MLLHDLALLQVSTPQVFCRSRRITTIEPPMSPGKFGAAQQDPTDAMNLWQLWGQPGHSDYGVCHRTALAREEAVLLELSQTKLSKPSSA